ncbi:MAG: hypothetical protein KDK66_02260, partial [Deltaproteobacteria bacterium]|nr:hypothetical protein [Deltaproteobacteria bacterium]
MPNPIQKFSEGIVQFSELPQDIAAEIASSDSTNLQESLSSYGRIADKAFDAINKITLNTFWIKTTDSHPWINLPNLENLRDGDKEQEA